MKKYESYKDSGIEWIGEIPSHWEVKRIRHVAQIFGRIGYRGYTVADLVHDGDGAITVSPSNMKDYNMDFTDCTYLSWEKYEESPEIKIYNGDILFVKTGSTYGKSTLVKDLPKRATINPQIIVLKEITCNNSFLWYSIKAPFIQLQVEETVVGGTIPTISQAKINNYTFPLPPLPEQTAIASYLDRKTAEIDQLIADKKRLLELYEEEKTAIINQAVTKGLDPNVPMKDSGIEWLGEIPEHWEVKRLRFIGKCQNGISKGGEYFGRGSPFVSYGDVYKNSTLPMTVEGLVESTEEDKINFSVEKGDVFFTRTSETIEEIGIASTCHYTIEDAVFAGFLIRFRPKIGILYEGFSKYFFRAQIHRRYFVKEMNLVTRASLSQELLKKLPVLLTTIDEQKRVASFLDDFTKAINLKIQKTQKLIDLLTEYRTALISEVVTGKIKVTD